MKNSQILLKILKLERKLYLTHLIFGILLSITIIGFPWGKQHFKLMSLALTPFGREIVDK